MSSLYKLNRVIHPMEHANPGLYASAPGPFPLVPEAVLFSMYVTWRRPQLKVCDIYTTSGFEVERSTTRLWSKELS